MPISKKLRRSILKRYDRVRQWFGLSEAPGWCRQREEGWRLWSADAGGHQELLYDHPIGANDTVLDLGGYEGGWTAEIVRRYGATVHVFEPAPLFHENIERRFRTTPNVHTYCFGLAGSDQTVALRLADDASAVCEDGEDTIRVELRDVGSFLDNASLEEIALTKINIEGGEYELLESMLDRGLAQRFRNLQIQFHTFAPNASARMAAIQRRLAMTHERTFSFPFVWENWRRRDAAQKAA